MDYKLRIAPLADLDLDEILDYIVNELFDTNAAYDFYAEVKACYSRLIVNPYMYALCNDSYLAKCGFRRVSVKNYLIIYTIDDMSVQKRVLIHRIFHETQDYRSLI